MNEDQKAPFGSIAVIGGAGLVGAGGANQLALNGLADDIYLTDVRSNVLAFHVVDMAEAELVAGVGRTRLHAVDDIKDIPEVDLVILAASKPESPNGDRREFLAANARLLNKLAPEIVRMVGSTGSVLLLSNPVDILAGALQQLTDLDPKRITGYSYNDSIRFRMAVARELEVPARRVGGEVFGEHGAGQVLLFSRLKLDGEPLTLSAEAIERIRADADGWFARMSALQAGRSSGWTTPVGTLAHVRAMASQGYFPASVSTRDLPDMESAYMTLGAQLCPEGMKVVESIADLTRDERLALTQAAASVAGSVAETIASLDDE